MMPFISKKNRQVLFRFTKINQQKRKFAIIHHKKSLSRRTRKAFLLMNINKWLNILLFFNLNLLNDFFTIHLLCVNKHTVTPLSRFQNTNEVIRARR